MNKGYEEQYLELGRKILNEGVSIRNKRTGEDCITIPEHTLYYDVANDPPPLLTTKQSFPVSAWAEMLGYLRRYEWADQFDKIGSKTWYGNANETEAWLNNPHRLGENHLGAVYGAGLDPNELPELFNKLVNHYDDRGLVIDFWKPELFDKVALRSCMYRHTFTIIGDTLYLESNQRSSDYGCGINFNSLQCYFLLKFFSHITGLKAGKVKHNMVNVHIYSSHVSTVREQLEKVPQKVVANCEISEWVSTFDDLLLPVHARDYFKISNYDHQGKLTFKMVT